MSLVLGEDSRFAGKKNVLDMGDFPRDNSSQSGSTAADIIARHKPSNPQATSSGTGFAGSPNYTPSTPPPNAPRLENEGERDAQTDRRYDPQSFVTPDPNKEQFAYEKFQPQRRFLPEEKQKTITTTTTKPRSNRRDNGDETGWPPRRDDAVSLDDQLRREDQKWKEYRDQHSSTQRAIEFERDETEMRGDVLTIGLRSSESFVAYCYLLPIIRIGGYYAVVCGVRLSGKKTDSPYEYCFFGGHLSPRKYKYRKDRDGDMVVPSTYMDYYKSMFSRQTCRAFDSGSLFGKRVHTMPNYQNYNDLSTSSQFVTIDTVMYDDERQARLSITKQYEQLARGEQVKREFGAVTFVYLEDLNKHGVNHYILHRSGSKKIVMADEIKECFETGVKNVLYFNK